MSSGSDQRQRNPAPDVDALVKIIDKLRERYVSEIDQQLKELTGPSSGQERKRLREKRRRYSVETINVNGLTSFRNLRYGLVQYPPSRDAILGLADYLGCNLLERNRLLLSVGYQPLQVWLTGAELEVALKTHSATLAYLPIPGFIINRDWSILEFNAAFLRLYAITEQEMARAQQAGHANLLRLIFDPAYSFYRCLNPSGDERDPGWRALATANVRAFKQQNYLSWEEPWYMAVRDSLKEEIGLFEEIWEKTNIDTPILGKLERQASFMVYRPDKRIENTLPIKVMSVHLTIGDFDYPQVLAHLPKDGAARDAFAQLGLPVPENNWRSVDVIKDE